MIGMIRRDWNEFFFSLRPATPVALFRILFGLVILAWCALQAPQLVTWYSQDGFFPLSAMHTWGMGLQGFNVLEYVRDFRVTVALFCLLVISAAMVTAGYKTRIASIVMWVLLLSFHHRDLIILNGGDTLQRNLAFLLMFTDAGAACSVDRLIRIARGQELGTDVPMTEVWPQRLIQLQLCAVYISTVASKDSGPAWMDGTALYYALHLTDLQRFTLFGLRERMWFITAMTYFTLAAELSLGTLIWIRRLRPYVLLMGVMLHMGIEYAMNVPLFAYTMISTYTVFVPIQWIDALTAWLHRQFRRNEIVLPETVALHAPAAELVIAMDSFHLVSYGDVDTPVDSSTIRRVMWRFPGVWAFVFLPAALALVILPIRWMIVPFVIVWPAVMLYLMARLSDMLAAQIAQESELRMTPALEPVAVPAAAGPSIKQSRRSRSSRARAAR